MLDAINLNGLHGRPLERGQQDTPQRVAERVTIATLKRLGADACEVLADLLYRHLGSDEFGHCYLQTGRAYLE